MIQRQHNISHVATVTSKFLNDYFYLSEGEYLLCKGGNGRKNRRLELSLTSLRRFTVGFITVLLCSITPPTFFLVAFKIRRAFSMAMVPPCEYPTRNTLSYPNGSSFFFTKSSMTDRASSEDRLKESMLISVASYDFDWV